MPGLTVLDGTLAHEHLALVRDRATTPPAFRRAVGCLTTLAVAAALRDLAAVDATVETPVASAPVRRAARRITLVPILRAGLAMLEPALALMPERARVGFLGMARDEATLRPRVYLESLPDDLTEDDVVALDVMIATGGSSVAALSEIQRLSPASLRLVGIIAAPEGLRRVAEVHPGVHVTVAAVDERLDHRGFIVPGLGDAGDRLYAPARPGG
ncbi:MAG TPA: uracil phosphoribosyltransferase [Miltoncostaeaceae bacterium]|nr:uracil phosphoribosyltransferase [Miltoncostaeaceae bacterium]